MTRTVTRSQPLIDVHARIPREQYDRMVQECGHCACSMTGFIRTAINREIGTRKQKRQQLAQEAVIEGQLELEGAGNAD